jgi:hypothetical protein
MNPAPPVTSAFFPLSIIFFEPSENVYFNIWFLLFVILIKPIAVHDRCINIKIMQYDGCA